MAKKTTKKKPAKKKAVKKEVETPRVKKDVVSQQELEAMLDDGIDEESAVVIEASGNPGIGTETPTEVMAATQTVDSKLNQQEPDSKSAVGLPKNITMIRNYKPSYKVGYLYAGQTYTTKDIIAAGADPSRLLATKWAKTGKPDAVVSHIIMPQQRVDDSEKIDREEAIRKLRQQAKERRGG